VAKKRYGIEGTERERVTGANASVSPVPWAPTEGSQAVICRTIQHMQTARSDHTRCQQQLTPQQ
jgi:hypothetical protein